MSVQTGIETPRGPASQRLGDRFKYRVRRWRAEPNPLWMREMRQSARMMRTPIVLMVLTVLMTLLLASLGGIMTGNLSPAQTGTALFHVFFSLAFFVVTLVGPALGANSIASEREGHTWEAVLLTGMRPEEVARGKFLAACTAIAVYIVALAPVGAIPFLFGGVTALEVLVAFVFLFLIALLGVAFGLAVSSKMSSLRVALLVTLLLAIPISLACFLGLGVGLSAAVHELWEAVDAGPPVWLPTAYGRAPFGLEYLAYLVAVPLGAIVIPAWFLYEVTRASLTSVTDDRSFGLKRWFLISALALAAGAAIPLVAVPKAEASAGLVGGMCAVVLFLLFGAFLFAGEPIGPSRRVAVMLAEVGAGRLRRFVAPGVVGAAALQLILGLALLALLGGAGAAYLVLAGAPRLERQIAWIVVFTPYAAGFIVFVVGLAAYLRVRTGTTAVARVLLLVFLFFLALGPWIGAAISGLLATASGWASDAALAVASPSPFYVFVALDAVHGSTPSVAPVASTACAVAYAVIGFLLVALARRRCNRIIRQHEQLLAEADRRLAEEDAMLAAAAAGAPTEPAIAGDTLGAGVGSRGES
ncbi:MAG: ABC transporter permease [Deltaproteobacteria bacterium]|nr:ABC transporter permease [Deltaproteobacteria bacterium]